MIVSRGVNLLRKSTSQSNYIKSTLNNSVRSSHGWYVYRKSYKPEKMEIFCCNALGGFFWWWIFWHFWHQPDHLFGEFAWPDIAAFTDEELGIPPDDED